MPEPTSYNKTWGSFVRLKTMYTPIIRDTKKKMVSRVRRACQLMVRTIKQNSNRVGGPIYSKRTGKIIGRRSSRPGSWPFKRSGKFRNSVGFDISAAGRGTVHAKAEHGSYLQEGTKKMQARPWLSLAWRACRTKIRLILAGKG